MKRSTFDRGSKDILPDIPLKGKEVMFQEAVDPPNRRHPGQGSSKQVVFGIQIPSLVQQLAKSSSGLHGVKAPLDGFEGSSQQYFNFWSGDFFYEQCIYTVVQGVMFQQL